MSGQAAKRSRVIIGTISNGQGGVVEVSAAQRGVGNAQVQFGEKFIREFREFVHNEAAKAHATFHPGVAKPQYLKKRKHYPKTKKSNGQHGGKKTRKLRRGRMTRRK